MLAPQAKASLTLIQHTSKDAGTTASSSLAFPANNTSGNWIGVVIRGGHSGQVFTVSDTRGNTYKQAVQFNQTLDAPNGETLAIFYAENIGGGANTVTVAESIGNNTLRFAILEYAGVATSSSIDVTAAGQGSGTSWNSGSATTTVGGDLILGEVSSADSRTFTAGSGYAIEEQVPAAPNTKLIVEDGIQAAAGAVSVGASVSSSSNGGALLAAFKTASGTLPPPSISGLTPNIGPVRTSITISGANFGASQGTSTVTFNGKLASPTSWGATSIAVPVPAGATNGNVVVTVGGVASNGVTFTVAPAITSLNPTSASVGYFVTITGTSFGGSQGSSIVGFNGTTTTPTSWSDTSITAPVPTGATPGPVVVILGNGVSSNVVNFTVNPPTPTISGVSPSSGAAGASVNISGIGFGTSQGVSTVTFSGLTATVNSWSTTSINAVVPVGAATGSVVVKMGGVASNAVPFTVLPSISGVSPISGVVGSTVTIQGNGFGMTQGSSMVTFNGIPGAPTFWSASSINVPVPTGATTGSLLVTVGGVASNEVTFTVTVNTTPPTAPTNLTASAVSGGEIDLAWTASTDNVGVTGYLVERCQGVGCTNFAQIAVVPEPNSPTSMSDFAVAPSTSYTYRVRATDAAGNLSGYSNTASATTPSVIITSLSPTLGVVGTSVTITGVNFGSTQGASTVSFNGTLATATSWSAGSIVAKVPAGAITGNVFVTIGGQASNGSNFTVTPPSAIALVQHASKDAGTASASSLAFPSNNTAGNWIAVAIRAGKSGQVFTVSDSLHNAYRAAAQFNVTVDTPNGDTLGVFYAENIAGGANTVTVSDSISGNTMRFAIFEYAGVALANSMDAIATGQGTSATPNSGSINATGNGELLLGAVMTGSPATFTAGTGYKIEEVVPAEPNTKLISEDQIQTTAGSASAGATLAASDHWGAVLAAFKAANSGVTGPTMSALNPTFGPVGTSVTITGANFGGSQGSSIVAINGVSTGTASSWSGTSITVAVPTGSTTGNVVVTVGGIASNGVTYIVTPSQPVITNLSPGFAIAGAGSFTLTVNGANFLPSSTVQWNGSARATTFVSTTELQATISSSDVTSVGASRVTVATPGFGGSTSAASTFFVGSTGGSNFAVISINQDAQDIVYDPKNQVFYLSVPGTAATNPNTIAVLDPATATITSTVPTGNNPNVVAISSDSQFLYAGIDGAASVQRFLLPGVTPDISYGLGSNSFGAYFALDLQVAPGAPHTTAVTLGNTGVSPAAQGGITIFDDATPRPTTAPGNVNLYGSLQWGADSSTLFASNTETTFFDFYTLAVNSGGVTLNQDFPSTFTRFGDTIHFDPETKLVYSEEGHAINPSTGLPVGNFNTSGSMAVDSSLNTVFVLSSGPGATIQSFDLTHFTPISSIPAPAIGPFSHLIRWGQNGLAFISSGSNGSGQIFLVAGSFIEPAPVFTTTPPPTPVTPPTPAPNAPVITSLAPSSAIAGGGAFVLNVNGTQFDPAATVQFNGSALATTYVSSTQLQAAVPAGDIAVPGSANIVVANPQVSGGTSSSASFFVGASGGVSSAGTSFAMQIVNQASKDIAFDPADQLFYLSAPTPAAKGNTIAVLDPRTLQIVGEEYAGSNPDRIVISDDGQFLYAGIDGSSSVERFTLPSLAPDIIWSLGAGGLTVGPYFALDLQVAPGLPHTTAVTRGAQDSSPAALGGIEIFDDAVARPTIAKGFGPGGGGSALYDSLQWGIDTTTLYAANDEDSASDFYVLSVSSNGVVQTNDYLNTFSTSTNRIHFDSVTKLVYADDGHVINPATGQSVGQFAAFGRMAPDSTLNLAFFASEAVGGGTVTIQSFDLTHFTAIGSITVSGVTGNIVRLIRWGQNGLAFNTDSGQIVLVGGNFVH